MAGVQKTRYIQMLLCKFLLCAGVTLVSTFGEQHLMNTYYVLGPRPASGCEHFISTDFLYTSSYSGFRI